MTSRKITKLTVHAYLPGDTHAVPAAALEMAEEGATVLGAALTYGRRYAERANAIEIDPVSLKLSPDFPAGNPRFPANGLTQFGGIRDAAPDAWGRRVIENRLNVPPASLAESTYLLEAGGHRVGALDFSTARPNEPLKQHRAPDINRLSYLLDAALRIERGERVPAQLNDIFDAGTSLGAC
jgi:serine/threonine-protein kinase HipA